MGPNRHKAPTNAAIPAISGQKETLNRYRKSCHSDRSLARAIAPGAAEEPAVSSQSGCAKSAQSDDR